MLLSEAFPDKFPFFVESCINEMRDILVAPKEELVTIIDTFYEEFESELTDFDYSENTDNRYMDTAPREILHDAFGRYLTGMNWPCYGDSQEYKENFISKFRDVVESKGWQLP